MTTAEAKKKITVTMSERAPLKIDPAVWPLIAEAYWFNGEIERQANYIRRIKVREHADGRRLVYGFHTSGSGGAPMGFRGSNGGYLIEAPSAHDCTNGAAQERHDAETIRAIRRVAGIIGDDSLGDECIADLPARELA